jgi:hypothetical protein
MRLFVKFYHSVLCLGDHQRKSDERNIRETTIVLGFAFGLCLTALLLIPLNLIFNNVSEFFKFYYISTFVFGYFLSYTFWRFINSTYQNLKEDRDLFKSSIETINVNLYSVVFLISYMLMVMISILALAFSLAKGGIEN